MRVEGKLNASYEYSSTQIQVPDNIARKVLDFGLAIPDDSIYLGTERSTEEQDAWNRFGREDDVHITVKYGLHDSNPEPLIKCILDQGPIDIALGQTSLFEDNESYDVLKIDVMSDALHDLNSRITQALESTDTYPEYHPHITIAYLKKGLGADYAGSREFEGKIFKANSIVFSNQDGDRFTINLPPATSGEPGMERVTVAVDKKARLVERLEKRATGAFEAMGNRAAQNQLAINMVTGGGRSTQPTQIAPGKPYFQRMFSLINLRRDPVKQRIAPGGMKINTLPEHPMQALKSMMGGGRPIKSADLNKLASICASVFRDGIEKDAVNWGNLMETTFGGRGSAFRNLWGQLGDARKLMQNTTNDALTNIRRGVTTDATPQAMRQSINALDSKLHYLPFDPAGAKMRQLQNTGQKLRREIGTASNFANRANPQMSTADNFISQVGASNGRATRPLDFSVRTYTPNQNMSRISDYLGQLRTFIR